MRSVIALAACAWLSASAAQAADKLIIGTEAGFAPFAFVDSSGQVVGLEIDMGNAICKRADLECEWSNVPWDGLFTGLDAGKFDAVIAGVTITEERKKRLDFSEPYFTDGFSVVAPKGSGLVASHEGLKNVVVGTLTGTAVSGFMKEHWPDVERRDYPSWDEAWVDLTAGRVDAILGYKSQMVTTYLSKPENSAKYEIVGDLDDPDFPPPQFGIAFSKDNHPYMSKIDAALASLKADKTLDGIVEKYLPGQK